MPKQLAKLTDPEFEIMKIVWDRGKVTINEVFDAVNSLFHRNLRERWFIKYKLKFTI